MNIHNVVRRISVIFFSLMVSFLTTSPLYAAIKASISGPSQAQAGETVVLNGMHFSPGATFTVNTQRGDVSSNELVTADADGKLQYQLYTSAPGKYLLKVKSDSGKVVATTMVTVHAVGG